MPSISLCLPNEAGFTAVLGKEWPFLAAKGSDFRFLLLAGCVAITMSQEHNALQENTTYHELHSGSDLLHSPPLHAQLKFCYNNKGNKMFLSVTSEIFALLSLWSNLCKTE